MSQVVTYQLGGLLSACPLLPAATWPALWATSELPFPGMLLFFSGTPSSALERGLEYRCAVQLKVREGIHGSDSAQTEAQRVSFQDSSLHLQLVPR